MSQPTCRFCSTPLEHTMVDLGSSPLANAYLGAEDLQGAETFYPLRVYVCGDCRLVQLPPVADPERIFADYAYFSSYSPSFVRQAEAYADAAVERFGLGPASRVMEVASNDGYLLRHFQRAGVPVLGIEPARNVAETARNAGIDTIIEFFGTPLACRLRERGLTADLLVGNNVLAHVPALNDFVGGLSMVLNADGVISIEVPHLMRLVGGCQFDTIYHEHFSYFSLLTLERIFARHQLLIFDVEEIPTHGGSLRVFARHQGSSGSPVTDRLVALRDQELAAGFDTIERYVGFGATVSRIKRELLTFLIDAKNAGRTVVGYGAPAKACTLLNYCGIRTDLLEYTVDHSPHKQGRYLPGVRIPIYGVDHLCETRPDFVLILPWNLRDEIVRSVDFIQSWGARFVVPVPSVAVL